MKQRRQRGKKEFKKKPSESMNYRNFISNSTYSLDSTRPITNNSLLGSSEVDTDYGNIIPADTIKKKEFKYQLLDWIKKNLIPSIISAIVIAIGGAVIAHQVNLAVINQRLDTIENQIELLSNKNIDMEKLDLKLEKIKTEADSSYSITLNDIKWQIKELEDQINELKHNTQY